jgi:hypothetical protein
VWSVAAGELAGTGKMGARVASPGIGESEHLELGYAINAFSAHLPVWFELNFSILGWRRLETESRNATYIWSGGVS